MPAKIRVKRGKIGEAGRGRRFGQTDTQTDKREKSLPNNGLEDPILVVNHCVGISAQLRCAEDPHSVQYSHAQVIASAKLLHHNFR